ncbi:MAG: hypothetical protein PHT54_00020 [Candidatus Nanoarchaeia archaeon]|nr:hypothetical protein [Candidatus Nanoarchaeia archaeon]
MTDYYANRIVQTFYEERMPLETMLRYFFCSFVCEKLAKDFMDLLSQLINNNLSGLLHRKDALRFRLRQELKEGLKAAKIKNADKTMISIHITPSKGHVYLTNKKATDLQKNPLFQNHCEIISPTAIKPIGWSRHSNILEWNLSPMPLKDFMKIAVPIFEKFKKDEWAVRKKMLEDEQPTE